MLTPVEDTTEQGYDLQFGVNALGHFYFTQFLLPALIATAKDTGKLTRVVNLCSCTAFMVMKKGGVDFSTLIDGPVRRQWESLELYKQSKAVRIMFPIQADTYLCI